MEPEALLPCSQRPATDPYPKPDSPCFLKSHFSLLLPYTPRSFKWSHPFMLSDQNFVCISHLSHADYAVWY